MNFKIYLICSEIDNIKCYKIGYTRRNINDRIKDFKTSNPFDFYIVDSFISEFGPKIESMLHKRFKNKLISGEWFRLNENDVKDFKKYCELYHKNIITLNEQNPFYDNGFISF